MNGPYYAPLCRYLCMLGCSGIVPQMNCSRFVLSTSNHQVYRLRLLALLFSHSFRKLSMHSSSPERFASWSNYEIISNSCVKDHRLRLPTPASQRLATHDHGWTGISCRSFHSDKGHLLMTLCMWYILSVSRVCVHVCTLCLVDHQHRTPPTIEQKPTSRHRMQPREKSFCHRR